MHSTTVALCTIGRVFFHLYVGCIYLLIKKQTGLNFAEKSKHFRFRAEKAVLTNCEYSSRKKTLAKPSPIWDTENKVINVKTEN